jgi:tetratricopeptide (TPR) repeat protein
LADATFRSTGESNAVPIFTNLMARFPNSPEAPLAQNWIADRSFSRGAYAEALKHFQLLYQSTNCPVDLAREARMMAGRAAFALQEFRDARTHFTELINVINALPLDTNNAPELLGRAYFALGDTIFQQVRDAGTNRTAADFSDAVEAFSKVGRYFAGTALGPAALGRLGQIHFQWALDRKDPKGFDAATNFFTLARDSAVADASTLWEAQHWIGRVLREQGRVDAALEAFTSILYAEEERKPDPLTVMNAGIEAGNILESQNRIAEAIRLYTRLMELEPSSRPAVDKRIEALRQRGAAAGG